jgi:mannose-6-phosphate isomerase-like protein (cupin superfamily)
MGLVLEKQRNGHVRPSAASTTNASPSELDAALLVKALAGGTVLKSERFDDDTYLDGIVEKPWGHEYRIYADPFYDIWKLFLLPGQATSMHCHPRKETVLICLGGRARMHFVGRVLEVGASDVVHIRKGVFHCTENLGDEPVDLVEVEAPRNKLDLVRWEDKYGRQGRVYETTSLKHSVQDLARCWHAYEGKARRVCIHNRYRFAVRAGMDILCRKDAEIMFLVSLSVMNAFSQRIEVVRFTPKRPVHLDLDGYYFTIGRST